MQALMQNATDAMKESRVPDILKAVWPLFCTSNLLFLFFMFICLSSVFKGVHLYAQVVYVNYWNTNSLLLLFLSSRTPGIYPGGN